MTHGEPFQSRYLESLVAIMRKLGVVEYTSAGISVKLGPEPSPFDGDAPMVAPDEPIPDADGMYDATPMAQPRRVANR